MCPPGEQDWTGETEARSTRSVKDSLLSGAELPACSSCVGLGCLKAGLEWPACSSCEGLGCLKTGLEWLSIRVRKGKHPLALRYPE